MTESKKEVVGHLSPEELEERIRDRKIDAVILRRLLFIKALYAGQSVPRASKEVGVCKATGYKWLDRWNENGLKGLEPNYGGGRPSKLTKEQKEKLKTILKERDDWTTKEVNHAMSSVDDDPIIGFLELIKSLDELKGVLTNLVKV